MTKKYQLSNSWSQYHGSCMDFMFAFVGCIIMYNLLVLEIKPLPPSDIFKKYKSIKKNILITFFLKD